MSVLLAAGFGALLLAALAELALQLAARVRLGRTAESSPPPAAPTRRRAGGRTPYLLGAVASVVFAVVGGVGVAGHPTRLSLDGWVGLGPAALSVDRLSGLFLLISFAVAAPGLLVAADWSTTPDARPPRGVATAVALLLGAVALIITADHVFVFLFGWECLTLAFYLLTAARRRTETVTPSLLTLVLGKASGQFAMLGLLIGAAHVHSFHLADLSRLGGIAGAGDVRGWVWVLLITGFGIKVGLVPGQIWLPGGYAAAPGPIRALLAGAAVNVGFYGLWRAADLLGAPPGWIPVCLLLLGGATALGGIAHATVQERLNRVIAYSSVENAGLIIVGYAVALIGLDTRTPALTAAGLLAATLQVIAHAIAKTTLFSAAGMIGSAYGTDDLEALRGVGRRMPAAGTALAVGSITLAGLPPTVGFVSEWFLLEAIAQQFRLEALPRQLAMAVAGAMVALTAGFAGVAFARLVAFTVLGRTAAPPRGRIPRDARGTGRTGLIALAAGCCAVAVLTPLEIRLVAAGLSPVVTGATSRGAIRSTWVVQPVYPGFSALSPTWLWIVMPLLGAATVAGVWLLSRGGMTTVRRVPAWRSASAGVDGADEYTPFGYSHPTRKVLATMLLTRNELHEVETATGGREGDEDRGPAGAHLGYTTDVVEVVEHYLYRPLLAPALALARAAKRLQSGRLDAYLVYMLIALVAVLAVVTATT